MNNTLYKDIVSKLDVILPTEICVNSQLFRSTDKGHLQRNYKRYREMMVVRFWLYLDLNPNLQKAENWLRTFVRLDPQKCEEGFELIYEFFRRENLLTYSVSRFKAALSECQPSAAFLLGPLWPRVEELFLKSPGAVTEDFYISVLRDVVQWTRVSSKLKVEMPTLEEEAYQRFIANELRLRDVWSRPDGVRDSYLQKMRVILSQWIDMKNFCPGPGHHGSGAVAENVGRGSWLKHPLMGSRDSRTDFFDNRFHFEFLPSYYREMIRLDERPQRRTSRPSTVPKNVKKVRMISMQPAALMYRQEAVLQGYYSEWIKPVVRRHFPIFDRSVNQALALAASRCGNRPGFATVDLSNASDSVSVHLIKGCTTGNLRMALMLNRVKSIGKIDLLETYATMGDASVFPTETLLIGAAVQLAINLAREYDPYIPNRFVVFGDDIICPNNYFVRKFLLDVLSRIGFVINEDKSFFNGPYRESCGVEAYLGHEIQPWYFRTEPTGVQRLQSIIGAANTCYNRGYRLTRRYFINAYAKECNCSVELLPFTEDPEDSSRFLTDTLTRGRFRAAPVPSTLKGDGPSRAFGQIERLELALKSSSQPVPEELVDAEQAYQLDRRLYEYEDRKQDCWSENDLEKSRPGPVRTSKVRRWVSVLDLTR